MLKHNGHNSVVVRLLESQSGSISRCVLHVSSNLQSVKIFFVIFYFYEFLTSKQFVVRSALRAAELTSNVSPEVTTPTPPLDGRDQQLDDVYKLLTNEMLCVNGHVGMCRPRLLTLTGCHGIGKSTLALAVSRRLISPPSETCSGPSTSDHDVTTTEGDVASKSSGRVYKAVVRVECRGCDGTRESLLARIFRAFGLPYRARHDNGKIYNVM